MKSPAYLTVVFCCLTLASAEAQSTAAPSDRERQVDQLFSKWDRPDSPGCALAAVHEGRVVYQRGYGSANLDYRLPITPESVFYIASVSKQFVAASIALLAREGKLALDDDVRKYVPELPDYGSTITIRHLVHHTSGLRDYLSLMPLAGMRLEDVYTNEELLALICRQQQLNFPPGEQYLYCNTGYFLLAEIVERASGKTLREYADEKIFKPLGMQHTHFHDNRLEIVENRVTGYTRGPDGGFRLDFPANWDKVGSGGLYSTVADLAKWDHNFDDPIVGGPEFLETMHSQTTLNDGTVLSYAFGLVHGETNGLTTVGHNGSFQGFRTTFLRFPEARFSVIIFSNLSDVKPNDLAKEVAEVYLAERFSQSLERYAGEYWSEALQASYTIEKTEEGLVLRRPATDPESLVSTGTPATFTAGGLQLEFIGGDAETISGFTLSSGGAKNISFERR